MKIFGKSYIYRERVHLRRWGIVRGRCFNAFHFGKRSFYLESGHSRPIGFTSIVQKNDRSSVN